MKRKRNLNFGFLPAHPTKAELVKSRRAFQARVRQKAKALGTEYKRLRKSAHSGRTASTRKLEALFHEVYGPGGMVQNPRELPGLTLGQLEAIERLIKGNAIMAKKRKSKKKSSRKGKMPAGLRRYWAKKRAAKAKRNPRKKIRVTRRRRKHTTVRRRRNYHQTRRPRAPVLHASQWAQWNADVQHARKRIPQNRPRVRRRKRRVAVRRSNPLPSRLNLGSGFTAGQIKKVARAVARITGKRTRIVRP